MLSKGGKIQYLCPRCKSTNIAKIPQRGVNGHPLCQFRTLVNAMIVIHGGLGALELKCL